MDLATPFDFAASGCSRECHDIRFTYFSPEEIRRVSVHQINDITSFDEWGEPLPGGLHAPALGPLTMSFKDNMGPRCCATCGLEKECPGHMGHIELAATLFNPFLVTTLLKLLQRTCIQCNKLKADDARTALLVQRLERLQPGELPKPGQLPPADRKQRGGLQSDCAADLSGLTLGVQHLGAGEDGEDLWTLEEVPARTLKEHVEAGSRLSSECAEAMERADLEAAKRAQEAANARMGKKGHSVPIQESACLESMRHVLSEYYTELSKSCPRCKNSSKWRKEGYSLLILKKMGEKEEQVCLPIFVRSLLRELWKNEAAILWHLLPATREVGPEVFFLDALLVPPNRFRPPLGALMASSTLGPRLARQTQHLKQILLTNKRVQSVVAALSRGEAAASIEELEAEAAKDRSLTIDEAIHQLQLAVNGYMDQGKSEKHPRLSMEGIRQLLEKKEGLFRMKMMGKRVNFAARSVISPDPNIETSEIGIPQMIAEELLYPEVATHHNAAKLRALVERGKKYPGAVEVHIPAADGSKTIKSLSRLTEEKRKAIAKQLITDIESGRPPMTVFRQLRDGDPLLVNRQPTLHKPGIMAHTAKVLRFEKTIRLHYVNCNTYNADFDGDEMNLHAPQDPIGRMEALAIARADRQYLVPTSGKPLRGLIQDHVIAGTMLTKRDTYYSRGQVCLLLYHGLRAAIEGGDLNSDWARNKGLERAWMDPSVMPHRQRFRLQIDQPTICKPREVWTGKQVFSMLVKNLIALCRSDRGRPSAPGEDKYFGKGDGSKGLNLLSKSKTPGDIWNGRMDGDKEEATVMWQDTDLLMGVLDKNQFGASTYGLIHLLFELMGGQLVGMLLAAMARLFTLLLQMRGFTCAFADLLLTEQTEDKRRDLIKGSRVAAKAAVEEWLKLNGRGVDGSEEASRPENLSAAAKPLFSRKEAVEQLEGMIIGKMKDSWSDMINQCIPIGQKLPFPKNCFAAMVQTGAKGSKVNHSQVSCCLGQQELEGRLPPLMSTHRALPCFAAYDLANRTRGYITDRFLNGIRPQEFFFHCMAGREGLVDTAVKTSRSGYLQRCLSKHLESLKVCYDLTVRDADGGVVQFLYGEDGADVTQSQYLFKFDEMRENFHFVQALGNKHLQQLTKQPHCLDLECAGEYLAARDEAAAGNISAAIKKLTYLIKNASELDDNARYMLNSIRCNLKAANKAGASGAVAVGLFEPVASIMTPAHFYGSTSELHEAELRKYLEKAISSKVLTPEAASEFGRFMRLKFLRCLAASGEAVGVIAAQSMGEPSTQMTLNTFHLAGHGGANVTLGIPRLREIIQTGSNTCKTPLMRVQVLRNESGADGLWERRFFAQATKTKFRRLTLMDCIARLVVGESVRLVGGEVVWIYQCRFEFLNTKELSKRVRHATAERLEGLMKGQVCRKLRSELKKLIEAASAGGKATAISSRRVAGLGELQAPPAADVGADGGADEEDGPRAGAEANPRKRARHAVGAEGKAQKEEAKAAEVDAELEEAEDDDMSDASGMYSSADEAEAEAGGAKKNSDSEEEDGDEEDPAAKAAAAQLEEGSEAESGLYDDPEDELENEAVKEEVKKEVKGEAKGDVVLPVKVKTEGKDKDLITPVKPGTLEKGGKVKMEVLEQPKPKRRKVAPDIGQAARVERGLADLGQALASKDFVWNSKLENDEMTIIVTHRYKECPHSLFVGEVLRSICEQAELQDPACGGVQSVHVKDENGEVWLECEGINLFGLQVLPPGTVDINRVYTNNIKSILDMFGVEAARAATVREVRAVFAHYGIEVDLRHLSLIADYMTQAGGIRAFNRKGLAHSTSPFQQMSFESTMEFMSTACKDGVVDQVTSPASAIVVGQPPPVGTGVVSLLADLSPPVPTWKKRREFKF